MVRRLKTYKSIHLAADVDEDANLSRALLLAFNGECCQDCGLHLVAKASDSSSDTRRDIPCRSMLQLETPGQQASEDGAEGDVGQPETIGRA